MKAMHSNNMSLTYSRPPCSPIYTSVFKNPGSKLNNAEHFVEQQDLQAGLLPACLIQWNKTMLILQDHIVHYSFPACEMPGLTSGNHKTSHFG